MDWQTVFIVIGGAAFAVFAGWCRWLTARIGEVEKELSGYKLEVSRQFASVDHLKEVEERLIKALGDLGVKFDRFAEMFQQHLMAVARQSAGRHGAQRDFLDDGT